jgi:ketosteroid isomerase-like protein
MIQGGNTFRRQGFAVGATALILAMVAAACAPQAADQSAEFAVAAKGWQAAYDTCDVDAIAAVYTEDCVVMPTNSELGSGHAYVKKAFGGMINAGLTSTSETVEAAAAGGVGYHVGTYTLSAPDGTVVDKGKFIEGWRKIDGEWKITHDIFNSDWDQYASSTSIIATHDVKEGDHWLAAWQGENSRHDLFAQHGVANVRVFQNAENPDQTGLLIAVNDMAAFEAMLNSDEGNAAKAEDGVIDKSMRVYMEVK